MTNIFGSIFADTITLGGFVLAVLTAAVLGLLLAAAYMYKNDHTRSFAAALVLIPAIEMVVIMLVNDNLGIGLSVAGSFALIRFRSVKGTAAELTAVFMAMTIGIICGSGYLVLGAIYTVMICAIMFLLTAGGFGQTSDRRRYLKITIPESLNYDEVFNDILNKYANSFRLEEVKTLNLGSLFRVEYAIVLKDPARLKEMIDALRTRNGNLEIMCGRQSGSREEL